jgi:preprotein translocase subunit SecG
MERLAVQSTSILSALQVIQIILSLALIVVIILQAKGMGLGSLFGGDGGMGITKTRRGLEKTLFQVTILLSAAFLINAVVQLMIH